MNSFIEVREPRTEASGLDTPCLPGVRIDALWEEHGVLLLDEEGRELRVGDVIEIIPNHVCPEVNLADSWYGVRGGEVERQYLVAGRGRTA